MYCYNLQISINVLGGGRYETSLGCDLGVRGANRRNPAMDFYHFVRFRHVRSSVTLHTDTRTRITCTSPPLTEESDLCRGLDDGPIVWRLFRAGVRAREMQWYVPHHQVVFVRYVIVGANREDLFVDITTRSHVEQYSLRPHPEIPFVVFAAKRRSASQDNVGEGDPRSICRTECPLVVSQRY